MSAKPTIFDFQSNLNISAGKNPPCTGKTNCTGDDRFTLDWWSNSNLRPANFLQICIALLREAALRSDIVLPNCDKTVVSCQGSIHTIEWESFAMRVFNDPAPRNALDATLASCLLSMKALTNNHEARLSYGKHSLDSRLLFSRHDILNSYRSLAGKTVDEMINGIRSIRILDFLQERSEFENDSIGSEARTC
ncbi:hypothetical protein T440DRAFT_470194 [Plenodomus tracheiphilus IPT5]|uniref:Uncharacterized protein n=1 Tax=Plenodomus tracheiphilus IPT5 TaxID=1408161 RepID=A0A6A7B1T5_9PLEO|nr:hypothetical protein T440DRAFT_470194 [Plenodomus tracheiphilus IPT5]